ncbi:hypothetical protein T07_1243 [Trichinella nelsoni]|uniref:Uncharacterized protein n=1 Tax=Trichinella nelsoni TaxID=6336 RepID=A0A0V0REW1_9BILA|nr:hypothetical protein T07_1243 [Trichinella nelsoni]
MKSTIGRLALKTIVALQSMAASENNEDNADSGSKRSKSSAVHMFYENIHSKIERIYRNHSLKLFKMQEWSTLQPNN